MKKIIIPLFLLSLLSACTTDNASQQSVAIFGDVINTSGASTTTTEKALELAVTAGYKAATDKLSEETSEETTSE